jgi:hypothetical protein
MTLTLKDLTEYSRFTQVLELVQNHTSHFTEILKKKEKKEKKHIPIFDQGERKEIRNKNL